MTKIQDILSSGKIKIGSIQTEPNDNVLILDGTNRYKSCFIRASEINDNGYYVGGYIGFLKSLAYIIRTIAPSRIVIVFDGAGGSMRRKKIYNEYKSNRSKIKKYNREMSSDGVNEEESLILQFKRLLDYLYSLPVTIITIDNIEADDTIAYIKTNMQYNKCVIVSNDKDFCQLIDDGRCTVFDPISKTIINQSTLIEKYNCSPKNFIYYKALLGDVSDNINGVKGIGKKTISSKFDFLSRLERIEIDEFYDLLDEKTFNKLNDDIDVFARNIDLMDLSSPIIDVKSTMTIRNLFTDFKYTNRLDLLTLKQYIVNDGVTGSFRQFDKWVIDSFGRLDYILNKI